MFELEQKIIRKVRDQSPSSIALDVTSMCNFKCLHCYNESGVKKSDDLTDEEFLKVVEQIKEIKPISLCFCGGEPLMRFELVLKATKILKGHVGQINMVSNGWFATREVLLKLKQAGLHTYQLSLDGFNSFQHDSFRGVPGAFDHVVEAIKNSVKIGIQTAVAITPNKLNFKSITQIVDLCYELGVSVVRSMPLIPMGRGYHIKKLMLSSNEYIIYQMGLSQLAEKYRYLMNVEWGDPLDHLRRMPENAKQGINTFELDIKSNGDIVPSTYFPITVGNVKKVSLKSCWEQGFKHIWENKKLLSILNTIIELTDIENFFAKQNSDNKIFLEN